MFKNIRSRYGNTFLSNPTISDYYLTSDIGNKFKLAFRSRKIVMEMDTLGRKRLLDGYDNISLDGLQEEMCRLLGLQCQFIMDTRERPFGGSECVIVVLEDEKGSKWAVRFPLQFRAFREHVMLTIKKEAELRLAIEKANITGITRLNTFSTTFDNPAGFPFIVFEWAEGTQLRWTESYPALPQRNKVIRSVAQIVLDLLKIQNKGWSCLHRHLNLVVINRHHRIYSHYIYNNPHQS